MYIKKENQKFYPSTLPFSLNKPFRKPAFNQPLADWDVSKAKDMRAMFFHTSSFNQPLADWGVFKVEDMRDMFDECPIAAENKPQKVE